MKTDEQVDSIMSAIPAEWRRNWCGGERGPCFCLGCVQIGNRAVISEKIRGKPYMGDPEYISEEKLREHGALYTDNKISREEWEAWMQRHPQAVTDESLSKFSNITIINGSLSGDFTIEGHVTETKGATDE